MNGGQEVNEIKNNVNIILKSYGNIYLQKTVSRAIHYRDDLEGNVNLSKYSFSKNQFKLLNKILKLLSYFRIL